MVNSPGIYPMVSTLVGNVCLRAFMFLASTVVRWSYEWGMMCTLWV